MDKLSADQKTANAFAASWNTLPSGSIYTYDQFCDWLGPLTQKDIKDKKVLELGCGNGSLMLHMLRWQPYQLTGIDLGDAVVSAKENLSNSGAENWNVEKGDLVEYHSDGFDIVYCIGVLHHLADPRRGFESVLNNTKSGGCFHCWVYAKEGNTFVRIFVEPIRKITSKLPWWFTKFFVALVLAIPFFLYAKILSALARYKWAQRMPMSSYMLWIAKRGFRFFWHVGFDQLVTPHTIYFDKSTITSWLESYDYIIQGSTYIIMRNGNSWKFGGIKK